LEPVVSDKVNSRVSPALDPETYRSIEGYNDGTRGYVDDVVSVMNDIYATLGKLHEAKRLADSNMAWTPENRILIVGKEVSKQKDRLAQRLDHASRDLDSRIAHTEGELMKPIEARALGSLNAEIRGHAKGLDRAGRFKLIREALEADDETTLVSILGSPPYLSGLANDDRDHYLHKYHSRKSPQLVARLALMTRVRETMNNTGANGSAFHLAFDKVAGTKPQLVQAIDAANERALAALNIEPTV
jgi:hypothetical protein